MCGIVGYIGEREALPILINSLKKLEYRGYDSCGLALLGSEIRVFKDKGRIGELQTNLPQLSAKMGLGHTRWATHGEPSKVNAHPHLDCTERIAVVHNGVITNFQKLKERLLSEGHFFISETDTEVIAHLIEEYMEFGASLDEALCRATKELNGYYAILTISSREPGKIVAACKRVPLLVGLGSKENFIASDILAFIKETKKVIQLEDDELAILTNEKVRLFNQEGKEVKREPEEIKWSGEDASKQGYEFFMLKEIIEVPQAAQRALIQDKVMIAQVAREVLKAREVIFTACGTSRHAALLGRYLFSRLARKFSEVIMSSEFQYYSDSIEEGILVIAVSQSGETADVLEGVRQVREKGATIVSIINKGSSPLARMSDRVIYLNCGSEIGVAATKSFVGQLIVLYLLAFAMAERLDEGIEKLKVIPSLLEENLAYNDERIAELAQKLKESRDCYCIARGSNLHIASEAALKLKEISCIHAEGMPAGELKHGTLALIEKGTPIIAICPSDCTSDETLSNVAEAKSRGAFIIGVSDCQAGIFDEWIKIPQVEEIFYPLVTVVPLQLLAYYLAKVRGLDPDKPRNLAKSVTVR